MYEIEHRIIRWSDCATRIVHEKCENIKDSGGKVIRALGMTHDITERREAEEALRASEEKYKRLVETTRTGFVVIDDQGRVIDANTEYVRLTGRQRLDDILGRSVVEWTVPHDRQRNALEVEKCLKEGFVRNLEIDYLSPDGKVMPIELNATVFRAAGTVQILTLCRDISDRRRSEEALRESEEKLRLMFETSPVGMVMCGMDGTFIYANDAYLNIIGYTREEFVKLSYWDVTPRDYDADEARQLQSMEATGKYGPYEKEYVRKTGERIPVLLNGSVVTGADGVKRIWSLVSDITERKAAEAAIAQSERKFRSLFESMIEGVAIHELVYDAGGTAVDYRLIDVNPAYEKHTGLTRERVKGRLGSEAYGQTPAPYLQEFVRTATTGDPVSFETYFPPLRRHFHISVFSTVAGRFASVFEDITERKAAETARFEALSRFSGFANASQFGMGMADLDGRIVYANPTLVRLLGETSPEDCLGKNFSSAYYPESMMRKLQQDVMPALMRDGQWHGELELRTKDGRHVTTDENYFVIYDESGNPRYLADILTDITDRKRAEKELRETSETLSAIVKASPEAIIALDPDGRVLVWSPAAERMFGWSEHEAVGRLLPYVPPEKLEEHNALRTRALQGEVSAFEVVRRKKDGSEIVLNISVAPLRDDRGETIGVISINSDITDRKRAEEDLRRTAEELRRSNRDLEQFAYVASHDLQEPLRMVTGYMDLLEAKYKDRLDKDADEFIAFAVDGARRMQRLISDLLAYSRVGTRGKEFQPVSMQAAFDRAVADLWGVIRDSGADITHDPLPVVWADETQMAQVLLNLFNNAIKFRSDSPPRIHVGVQKEEGHWLFSVRDNGIGIEPRNYERIFLIFQRLHTQQKYPGSGIGLSICKKIIERHGGRIYLESQPGKGSTFFFTLPDRGKADHE